MMRAAVFPGSFDPITKGHEDIVLRALPLFEKIYIAVGINSGKTSLFPLETRLIWIKNCFARYQTVEVISYEGLTVNLCLELNARYIIRGIRNSGDFRYEKDIACTNRQLEPGIETIFLASSPQLSHISSSVIRDLYLNSGNYKQFMPDHID